MEFQIIQQLTLFCLARIREGGREGKEKGEREAKNWSGKSQETSMKSVGQERKAGSLNSLVTFALELIIVTLLNSPWLCEGHLL